MSEHPRDSDDGLLSMRRGYGGAGSGAAIVFDSAQIDARDDTPLIIAQVNYGSEQDRQAWLNTAAEQVARIIETEAIEDRWVHVISFAVFDRLKLFALFSKHDGF